MKKILVLLLLLLLKQGYSCDPSPDFFILENDTFIVSDYLYPNKYFRPFSGYYKKFVNEGGRSTACGPFKAQWKIKNDSLFLDDLIACNAAIYTINNKTFSMLDSLGVTDSLINKIRVMSGVEFVTFNKLIVDLKNYLTVDEINLLMKKYQFIRCISRLPNKRSSLDFKYLLKRRYKRNNLFANFYSGLFSIEIGENVDSMRIYMHRTSDKELFFQVKNGVVEKTFIANSVYIKKEFNGDSVGVAGYILPVLDNWIKCDSIVTNKNVSFLFKDSIQKTLIEYGFIEDRGIWNKRLRYRKAKDLVGNEKDRFENNYNFSDYTFLKLLFKGFIEGDYQLPYVCYVNGQNEDNTSFVKIIVLFTYYNKIKIVLKSNNEENVENLFNDLISKVNCEWVKGKLCINVGL